MSKKTYEVVRCVKQGGVEYDKGATVTLDQVNGDRLEAIGIVKTPDPKPEPKPEPLKGKGAKGDGL